MTSALRPFQSAPVVYWPECITAPLKASRPGTFGQTGMPLTPVATMMWRGFMVRSLPSLRLSVTVQQPSLSSQRPPASSVPVQKLSSRLST